MWSRWTRWARSKGWTRGTRRACAIWRHRTVRCRSLRHAKTVVSMEITIAKTWRLIRRLTSSSLHVMEIWSNGLAKHVRLRLFGMAVYTACIMILCISSKLRRVWHRTWRSVNICKRVWRLHFRRKEMIGRDMLIRRIISPSSHILSKSVTSIHE